MKELNLTGLEYGWDWEEIGGDELTTDIGLKADGVHMTHICTVFAQGNNDKRIQDMKDHAKAIKEVPNMIKALLEARRVCKQAIELAPEPVIPDEHEYALAKIEQALEDVGFEFEEKEKANKKAE